MKNIFLILILCSIYGCKDKSSYMAKIEELAFTEFETLASDYKYLIIIPNSGCTGCISSDVFAF